MLVRIRHRVKVVLRVMRSGGGGRQMMMQSGVHGRIADGAVLMQMMMRLRPVQHGTNVVVTERITAKQYNFTET